MRKYRPKRARKRWLEDAPDYVLCGKLWDESMGRTVQFLGLSEDEAVISRVNEGEDDE